MRNIMSSAPKDKPLLANKGFKSLNVLHPLLILITTLSNASLVALIVSSRYNFSTISRNWQFNSMSGQPFAYLDNPEP